MTLLELLRQELPKRGGWPEGGIRAWQSCIDGEIYFDDENDSRVLFHGRVLKLPICDNAGYSVKNFISREQYEATGWDGTNLPPVGCACEVRYRHGGTDWGNFECLTTDRDVAFGWCNDEPVTLPHDCYEFRPIRTEAERAIDEMVQLSGVSTGAAKILYDAGYRKE